jgi:hypothetical protein
MLYVYSEKIHARLFGKTGGGIVNMAKICKSQQGVWVVMVELPVLGECHLHINVTNDLVIWDQYDRSTIVKLSYRGFRKLQALLAKTNELDIREEQP